MILGGTHEAAALARRLADDMDVVTSWAGRTKTKPDLPGRLRVGGFGGAAGLCAYLADESIDAVIDATHPFAARISANAAQACAERATPRLMLVRPPWKAQAKDRWTEAADMAEAARLLPGMGRHPFLAIGVQELSAFAAIFGLHCLVRLAQPADVPFAADVIVARGPFALADEIRLLKDNAIDVLVAKNSGGTATAAKIEAAGQLGLPVLMIRRPPLPAGETVDTVQAASAWVRKVVSSRRDDWA